MEKKWQPLMRVTTSRSFGALRGLAMRRGGNQTVVQGTLRFGWNDKGEFQVEALADGKP